ncbi:AAA family ATPase [Pseudoalteromonas agarivorans]|uniref:AAA family ATPase n=1 Tax=Pseudoalteromonas agarivorans TaxID=176102 RepID=UPI00311DE442
MNDSRLKAKISRYENGDISAAFDLFKKNHEDGQLETSLKYMDFCLSEILSVDKNFKPKNKIFLKDLHLVNFRQFKNLKINFESDLTVIIGPNGSGKTSILDALTKTISFINARFLRQGRSGKPLTRSDVRVNCNSCAEVITSLELGQNTHYSCNLVRPADGISSPKSSQLDSYHEFSSLYRVTNDVQKNLRDEEINFPLFASYSVLRTYNKKDILSYDLEMLPKISAENRLDAIDPSAIDGTSNLDTFLEWYVALTFMAEESAEENKIQSLEDQYDSLKEIVTSDSHPLKSLLDDTQVKLQDLKSKKIVVKNNNYSKSKSIIDNALIKGVPGITSMKVDTSTGRAEVQAIIDNNSIVIKNLSQGQQVIIGILADVSRRLIMLNPTLDNPLHGQGVILIDEIEMHLHPKWQLLLLESLQNTFPNLQLILTTHSPQILSTTKKDKIRVIGVNVDNELIAVSPVNETLAHPSTDILESVMKVSSIPELPITAELKKYRDLIEQGDIESEHILTEIERYKSLLDKEIGNQHPEMIKLDMVLRRRKILG